MLMPAGGWNALPGWDNSYSLTNAMKKVHIDFWMDALISVRVTGDWVNHTKNVISVSVCLYKINVGCQLNSWSTLPKVYK